MNDKLLSLLQSLLFKLLYYSLSKIIYTITDISTNSKF